MEMEKQMKFRLHFGMHGAGAEQSKTFLDLFGVLETATHVFTRDGKVTFSAAEQGYYDALTWMNGYIKKV